MIRNIKKEAINVLLTIVAALLSAFALHIFVYPANFAPAGVDGIAAMLQKITTLNAGYFALSINIPLLIIAYFFLKKRYVIYTVLYAALSALMVVVLAEVDFYQYQDKGSGIVAAVFSGVMFGVRTGIMLRLGASSGGVDIVASMVHSKRKHSDIEKIISVFCYITIALSYFVYKDENGLNSVLLAVIQMFVAERATAVIMKDTRNAVEFKIITKNPEQIKDEILYVLKHGATIIDGKGVFTGDDCSVIITVVNIRQIPELLKITKKYPDTFVYYTDVSGVNGKFRWKKDDLIR